MERSRVKFTDLPKKISRERYETTKKKVIAHLAKVDDVVSVYQLGEISVVGISDLDFLVVLKDKMQDPVGTRKAIDELFAIDPYLIIHYPLIINESVAPDMHTLFPIFSLTKLHGKAIKVKPVKNKKLLSLITLADYIDFHWPREFLQYEFIKKFSVKNKYLNFFCNEFTRPLHHKISLNKKHVIPVRTLLCRLNSMKYPLKLLEQAGGSVSKQTKKMIAEFIRFRETWFSHKDYDVMLSYLDRIVGMSVELIGATRGLLERYITPGKQTHVLVEKGFSKVYLPKWNENASLQLSRQLYHETGELTSVLPSVHYPQRMTLHQLMMGSTLSFVRFIKPAYRKLLLTRYGLYKQHIDHLNTHQFPFKPIIKYDYLTTKPKVYKRFIAKRKQTIPRKFKRWIA